MRRYLGRKQDIVYAVKPKLLTVCFVPQPQASDRELRSPIYPFSNTLVLIIFLNHSLSFTALKQMAFVSVGLKRT